MSPTAGFSPGTLVPRFQPAFRPSQNFLSFAIPCLSPFTVPSHNSQFTPGFSQGLCFLFLWRSSPFFPGPAISITACKPPSALARPFQEPLNRKVTQIKTSCGLHVPRYGPRLVVSPPPTPHTRFENSTRSRPAPFSPKFRRLLIPSQLLLSDRVVCWSRKLPGAHPPFRTVSLSFSWI